MAAANQANDLETQWRAERDLANSILAHYGVSYRLGENDRWHFGGFRGRVAVEQLIQRLDLDKRPTYTEFSGLLITVALDREPLFRELAAAAGERLHKRRIDSQCVQYAIGSHVQSLNAEAK